MIATILTFYIICNIAGFMIMIDIYYLLHKDFYRDFVLAWNHTKVLVKIVLILTIIFIFIPVAIIIKAL